MISFRLHFTHIFNVGHDSEFLVYFILSWSHIVWNHFGKYQFEANIGPKKVERKFWQWWGSVLYYCTVFSDGFISSGSLCSICSSNSSSSEIWSSTGESSISSKTDRWFGGETHGKLGSRPQRKSFFQYLW